MQNMFSYPVKSHYWFFLILACLLLSGCLSGKDHVVRGVLHGDMVWQGIVYIDGDVVLEKDANLKIIPGTKIRFLSPGDHPENRYEHPYFPGSELNIKGKVYAVGRSDMPIVFEFADPNGEAGSWGAVNLEGSEEAVFEYCLFRQADSAVHSRESNVYIVNSIFENNLVAVRFHSSEMLVERNLIRNNHTGVRFHFGSPVIRDNEFKGNNVNVFITSYPDDYLIENNTFGAASDYQVVLGEQVPDDVRMPRNFWNVDSSLSVEEHFYDGRRSDYIGEVLTDPVRTAPSKQAGPKWSP